MCPNLIGTISKYFRSCALPYASSETTLRERSLLRMPLNRLSCNRQSKFLNAATFETPYRPALHRIEGLVAVKYELHQVCRIVLFVELHHQISNAKWRGSRCIAGVRLGWVRVLTQSFYVPRGEHRDRMALPGQ